MEPDLNSWWVDLLLSLIFPLLLLIPVLFCQQQLNNDKFSSPSPPPLFFFFWNPNYVINARKDVILAVKSRVTFSYSPSPSPFLPLSSQSYIEHNKLLSQINLLKWNSVSFQGLVKDLKLWGYWIIYMVPALIHEFSINFTSLWKWSPVFGFSWGAFRHLLWLLVSLYTRTLSSLTVFTNYSFTLIPKSINFLAFEIIFIIFLYKVYLRKRGGRDPITAWKKRINVYFGMRKVKCNNEGVD